MSPGLSVGFSNPRSCFIGVVGADTGRPTYSWATSAAVAAPTFVILAVIVATMSKSDEAPPGIVSPVSGPETGAPEIVRSV